MTETGDGAELKVMLLRKANLPTFDAQNRCRAATARGSIIGARESAFPTLASRSIPFTGLVIHCRCGPARRYGWGLRASLSRAFLYFMRRGPNSDPLLISEGAQGGYPGRVAGRSDLAGA